MALHLAYPKGLPLKCAYYAIRFQSLRSKNQKDFEDLRELQVFVLAKALEINAVPKNEWSPTNPTNGGLPRSIEHHEFLCRENTGNTRESWKKSCRPFLKKKIQHKSFRGQRAGRNGLFIQKDGQLGSRFQSCWVPGSWVEGFDKVVGFQDSTVPRFQNSRAPRI